MMDYLVSITKTNPLTLHFSFYNPDEAEAVVYVPRILGPLGYFITLEISDQYDEVVYETQKSKINLKLHPERESSYHALEPGYTYGNVFEVEDFVPVPGTYHIVLTYSNEEFKGFADNPLGAMTYETKLSFEFS
jgi:hypothetical protein